MSVKTGIPFAVEIDPESSVVVDEGKKGDGLLDVDGFVGPNVFRGCKKSLLGRIEDECIREALALHFLFYAHSTCAINRFGQGVSIGALRVWLSASLVEVNAEQRSLAHGRG